MTLTTPNRKAIVDFLWEWTEGNGDWSKLLVDKIVKTESQLSSTDREIIFNYFLQSINLQDGLPELEVKKPNYTPTEKNIELSSISDIAGVNRLAKNQSINFAENLTIIFGENGTGKTGYSRILKNLGFSYDTNKVALPNIFEEPVSQSATINYKSNGIAQTFVWDGTNSNTELENISVFNSNCVQFSIGDRNLIISPIGFHLFNLISDELNKLSQLIEKKISVHPTKLNWFDALTTGTPQKDYISGLSENSSEKKLIELADFSSEDEFTLEEKKKKQSRLNKELLQSQIQEFKIQKKELEQNIEKILEAQALLNEENWIKILDFNSKIEEIQIKQSAGIKAIAKEKGIQFYETPEFNSFIGSAEKYIKKIDQNAYPQEGSTCIYCLQPLEDTAIELLKSYRELFSKSTNEINCDAINDKKLLLEQISEQNYDLIFNSPTFGIDENLSPLQPPEIVNYNAQLELLKKAFIDSDSNEDFTFQFDYDEPIKFLTKCQLKLNKEIKSKEEILATIDEQENALIKEIAELTDRKFLRGRIEEVKNTISNFKIVTILRSKSTSFNTSQISRKTSSARSELIVQDFENKFKKELKALRKEHLKIDFNFATERGGSVVYQKIGSHALLDVLSEGEQKAISLAGFLTELQLDKTKAPIIFDDPVNSLDHNIIEEVAKRFLNLSFDRQIVVFTHSVLLFNSFLNLYRQKTFYSASCKFYNSRNEYHETGIITEAIEEINKVGAYISKINVILNNTPRDTQEVDVAENGYGYLRSAIELFVEHEIFQGTVKRYQKNVALTNFIKVDGHFLETHKRDLNEIFERCCGFIKGHSNPIEIYNSPTLAGLKSDFEEFKRISDLWSKNK